MNETEARAKYRAVAEKFDNVYARLGPVQEEWERHKERVASIKAKRASLTEKHQEKQRVLRGRLEMAEARRDSAFRERGKLINELNELRKSNGKSFTRFLLEAIEDEFGFDACSAIKRKAHAMRGDFLRICGDQGSAWREDAEPDDDADLDDDEDSDDELDEDEDEDGFCH